MIALYPYCFKIIYKISVKITYIFSLQVLTTTATKNTTTAATTATTAAPTDTKTTPTTTPAPTGMRFMPNNIMYEPIEYNLHTFNELLFYFELHISAFSNAVIHFDSGK